uniref:Uncharacterized protein n=1 Tax=viral metagenome TaxID=1070528 RepID=A0A6C0J014_9ZZZZ
MASTNELRHQAQSTLLANRLQAAGNTGIANVNNGQLLRQLAYNNHKLVRAKVAKSQPRLAYLNNGQLLRKLAINDKFTVRAAAAQNPSIANVNNGQLLRQLAINNQFTVREKAAKNPRIVNLNHGTLYQGLVKNNQWVVRASAAANPRSANVRGENGRPLILVLLHPDEHPAVRMAARSSNALKALKKRSVEDNVYNILMHYTGVPFYQRERVVGNNSRSRFATHKHKPVQPGGSRRLLRPTELSRANMVRLMNILQ